MRRASLLGRMLFAGYETEHSLGVMGAQGLGGGARLRLHHPEPREIALVCDAP